MVIILNMLARVLKAVEDNYSHDHSAYNAILDTIINFCQQHKKKVDNGQADK